MVIMLLALLLYAFSSVAKLKIHNKKTKPSEKKHFTRVVSRWHFFEREKEEEISNTEKSESLDK